MDKRIMQTLFSCFLFVCFFSSNVKVAMVTERTRAKVGGQRNKKEKGRITHGWMRKNHLETWIDGWIYRERTREREKEKTLS